MAELKDYKFEGDQQVCVKMRGLPYRATDEEVIDFFKDYKIKEDSLQWGQGEDGRKNGFGCMLLEDEDEASRACEGLNKQYVGSRWVGTSLISYNQWKSFMEDQLNGGGQKNNMSSFNGGGQNSGSFNGGGQNSGSFNGGGQNSGSFNGGGQNMGSFNGGGQNMGSFNGGGQKNNMQSFNGGGQRSSSGGGGQFERKTLKLSTVVTDDNMGKALAMRGLPFRVKLDEIKEFFSEVCEVNEDNIHIEEEEGRRSGAGLAVFENEEQAQEVKDALNRKEIGGRFIQLFDQNDQMWERLCCS